MSPLRACPVLVLTGFLLMSPLPTIAAESETPPPTGTIIHLDDFEEVRGWSAAMSPGARLEIAQDAGRVGRALRPDFEFQDGTGWVIARKAFPLRLPDNFAFHFSMRGAAPPTRCS
jgi:hypothetical protein